VTLHLLEKTQACPADPFAQDHLTLRLQTSLKKVAQGFKIPFMVNNFRPYDGVKLTAERRTVPIEINDLHILAVVYLRVCPGKQNGLRMVLRHEDFVPERRRNNSDKAKAATDLKDTVIRFCREAGHKISQNPRGLPNLCPEREVMKRVLRVYVLLDELGPEKRESATSDHHGLLFGFEMFNLPCCFHLHLSLSSEESSPAGGITAPARASRTGEHPPSWCCC
jgi:hypothetical protein